MVDVFYNKDLLHNIHESDHYMDIHCNAGVTSTNMVGDLPGYGQVWFHEGGITNILSLARVREKYRVSYDSKKGSMFQVWKLDGSIKEFNESRQGLFYLDMAVTRASEVALVATVEEKKSNYTTRDYSPQNSELIRFGFLAKKPNLISKVMKMYIIE